MTPGFRSGEKVSLIAIWMGVAPIPVGLLLFVALFIVCAIILVIVCQVAAVGVIFAVVPIVIVMVARIVDSDLNAGLWRRCGYD